MKNYLKYMLFFCFITNYTNINCTLNEDLFPLHTVVKNNDKASTFILLNYGNNTINLINQLDKRGYSPLRIAIEKNYYEIAQMLILAGANVNEEIENVQNKFPYYIKSFTLLDHTYKNLNKEMFILLLTFGADINKTKYIPNALNHLPSKKKIYLYTSQGNKCNYNFIEQIRAENEINQILIEYLKQKDTINNQ